MFKIKTIFPRAGSGYVIQSLIPDVKYSSPDFVRQSEHSPIVSKLNENIKMKYVILYDLCIIFMT